MNPKYKKLENESQYEYGLRLISTKIEDRPNDLDWEDIVDLLGLDCHRDSLRKAASVTEYSGYNVMKYYKQKMSQATSSDEYLKELSNKQTELHKERIKLETEKLEYNRWKREEARDELFEQKVIEAIKRTLPERENFIPEKIEPVHGSRFGLLNIADCHFGKDFKIYGLNNEIMNAYSPEIFKMRMNELFNEVVEYAHKQNLTRFKIFNLGDSLDGFLRHSQIWTLRYGVIDSAILYGRYMGEWLKELSNEFDIEYYQTCGNHGELRLLDGKKDGHLNDNIEKVTGCIIELINADNPNFKYIDNKSGFIFTEIAGYNVMGIHGEVKNLSAAIKDFSDIYNTRIDYLIAGHKHHSEYVNCGVRRGVIGVGSIIGSDDYSVTKVHKTADATASFIIFETGKGKVNEETFVLN